MDPNIILALEAAGASATVGAAYGAVKMALNGTKERIKNVEVKLDNHVETGQERHIELVQRATSVETKIDHLIESTRIL